MKTRVALSSILRRRKVSNLEEYCEKMKITTRDQLCGLLDDLGVQHPDKSATRFLEKKRASIPPRPSSTPKAPAKKSKSFSAKKKQSFSKSK